MKICDPFRESGWWFRVAEYHFELQCTCGVKQRADELTSRQSGDITIYDCRHCGARLVGIALDDRPPVSSPTLIPPVDDDGHRMAGFVFGSTVDMTLWPPGAVESDMDIPARPRFFTSRDVD